MQVQTFSFFSGAFERLKPVTISTDFWKMLIDISLLSRNNEHDELLFEAVHTNMTESSCQKAAILFPGPLHHRF